MEKKTKRQLECLGRRWTMINYTTHDKTFICICTKFSREDEDKLPNDSHSFAPGCFFFGTEGAINLIWLCHGTDTEFYGYSEWYLTYFFLFVIVWMDGVFWEGFLFGFLATISGYVCLNYSTSTIMMCKGSMIMIGGLWSKCHPKRTMDRQTDEDLWHHPLCLSGSIIMFIRGMYFGKIFHIIQIARIRRCQEFPYRLAAEYSIGACEWGGSWPCMRVCFGGKIEQFEIQSVALTESSKL